MKKIIILCIFVIFIGCGEEEIDNTPTFERTYYGSYEITQDDQSALSLLSIPLNQEISQNFIFKASVGSLEIVSEGFFNNLITDTDGTTTLTGTTTSKTFTINNSITNTNQVIVSFTGNGSYDDNNVEGEITATCSGGSLDKNVIIFKIAGSSN
jgi:hypothetical protein